MSSKQAIPIGINPAGMPAAGPLDGTEYVHVVQGGNSRVSTVQEIADRKLIKRLFTIQVIGTVPAANEILALYPAIDAFTLPINLSTSKGSVIVNPTAAFTITLARQVNGAGAFTTIATISVSVGGVVTWATAGGLAIAIAAGDVIKATGDIDGDTTFIGAFTVVGQQ